jgi:hypothetical protein
MTDAANPLETRKVPTLYFVGVTTTQSSIMRVFPKWSDALGLGADIAGYDAAIHAPAEAYRAIVQHIKDDPLSMGALVTTHKIDLLDASRDMFDYLDPYAQLCGEISCISKREGRLEGYARPDRRPVGKRLPSRFRDDKRHCCVWARAVSRHHVYAANRPDSAIPWAHRRQPDSTPRSTARNPPNWIPTSHSTTSQ